MIIEGHYATPIQFRFYVVLPANTSKGNLKLNANTWFMTKKQAKEAKKVLHSDKEVFEVLVNLTPQQIVGWANLTASTSVLRQTMFVLDSTIVAPLEKK